MRIPATCSWCGVRFIAKTTITKFCSLKCAQRAYKKRKRAEKLQEREGQEELLKTAVKVQEDKEFLSIADTVKLIGLSRTTIYRLLNSNKIPSIRLGGRVLISRKELLKSFEAK
jgi:excisionase family DNA binding protein